MRRTNQMMLFAALAACFAVGCTDEGVPFGNQPPETYLFVVSDTTLQTTHYIQTLSWHAEDVDSDRDSLHFEYRWILDSTVTAPEFNTDWIGVERPFIYETQRTFYLPVPTDAAATVTHRFEIRAVDGEGATDETPATAAFPVFNQAPQLFAVQGDDISSVLSLPASTLPVLSIQFQVLDPDNPDAEAQGAYIREIRLWFDESETVFSIPADSTLITLKPEHFAGLEGDTVTINLQAIDLGGAGSNILSARTFIQDIGSAKVLILDSAHSLSPTVTVVDPFWRRSIASLFISRAEVVFHDFEILGRLGHPDYLDLIFSLFEAVIWYNGGAGSADNTNSSIPDPEITVAEAGIVRHLEAGGKVLLTGYNFIGSSVSPISGGSFSAEFESDVLMLDSLYAHSTGTPDFAATSNWRIWPPNAEISGFPAAGTDTLQNNTALRGVDRMALSSEGLASGAIEELFRSERDRVQPQSLSDGAIGVRRRFESGGELVLITFPISLADGYDNSRSQVRTFLEEFGVSLSGAP